MAQLQHRWSENKAQFRSPLDKVPAYFVTGGFKRLSKPAVAVRLPPLHWDYRAGEISGLGREPWTGRTGKVLTGRTDSCHLGGEPKRRPTRSPLDAAYQSLFLVCFTLFKPTTAAITCAPARSRAAVQVPNTQNAADRQLR